MKLGNYYIKKQSINSSVETDRSNESQLILSQEVLMKCDLKYIDNPQFSTIYINDIFNDLLENEVIKK